MWKKTLRFLILVSKFYMYNFAFEILKWHNPSNCSKTAKNVAYWGDVFWLQFYIRVYNSPGKCGRGSTFMRDMRRLLPQELSLSMVANRMERIREKVMPSMQIRTKFTKRKGKKNERIREVTWTNLKNGNVWQGMWVRANKRHSRWNENALEDRLS